MKKEIKSCPVCGSINLVWVGGGLERIGVSTISGKSRCEDCERTVIPVYFTEKNYKKFLKHLESLNKK